MAFFKFTKAILEDQPIDVYNYGRMQRDFTYIDDIIEGVVKIRNRVPEPNLKCLSDFLNPSSSIAPYRIYNIGNNQSVELMYCIHTLEKALGKTAKMQMLPMQPGDVMATYADILDLERDVAFKPQTTIVEGIGHFVDWYKYYYG